MSRRKRSSRVLEKAERRAAEMLAIDPNLDLGNGLTLATFLALIQTLREKQNRYNMLLSSLDEAYNEMLDAEKVVAEQSERMLVGVAAKHGKNSNEYEMAGGKRKSERKRPTNKTTDSETTSS